MIGLSIALDVALLLGLLLTVALVEASRRRHDRALLAAGHDPRVHHVCDSRCRHGGSHWASCLCLVTMTTDPSTFLADEDC